MSKIFTEWINQIIRASQWCTLCKAIAKYECKSRIHFIKGINSNVMIKNVHCNLGVVETENWWGHKNRSALVGGFLKKKSNPLLQPQYKMREKYRKHSAVKSHFHSLCDGLKVISKIYILNKTTLGTLNCAAHYGLCFTVHFFPFSESLQCLAVPAAPLQHPKLGRAPPKAQTSAGFGTCKAA